MGVPQNHPKLNHFSIENLSPTLRNPQVMFDLLILQATPAKILRGAAQVVPVKMCGSLHRMTYCIANARHSDNY